jgi:hypothetical protein
MRTVDINSTGNTATGFVFGLIGGFGKFILSVHPAFWQNLLEAACIAVVSGACGVAGKEGYTFLKKKLKKK